VNLFLTKQAEKEFAELPKSEQKKAVRKLELLEKNPLLGKKLSGRLAAFRCLRFWPYRIIYHIDQIRGEIWVDHMIHRQRVYN